jgi:hypothetical protein
MRNDHLFEEEKVIHPVKGKKSKRLPSITIGEMVKKLSRKNVTDLALN